MSFNRRGPDRRPDRPDRDRSDRPPQRRGDWQPRERAGGDRPFPPRDRPQGDRPYQPRGGDRPYQGRGGERPYQPRPGGDRPYQPRPRFDAPHEEGAMSLRLDPRRVNALKHLAGEAGVRPGDLVRQWVEERIDGARGGAVADAPAGEDLRSRLEALTARVAALESATGEAASTTAQAPAEERPAAAPVPDDAADASGSEAGAETAEAAGPAKRVSAAPSGERVALHDEMIAVIRERGPMSAGELAAAIVERGRYLVPRSGKPLDAKTVSQRVSNPTYRSRFVRREGRIGLADEA